MAIEKLINHSQGEDIKTALNTIATNIQTVGAVSLETLGMGFTTCSTEQATAAKTATLTGYTIADGGIVSVKFSNAVDAGATLNINSQGAKPIYYKGAAITNSIINAGAIATFVYSNNQYQLINLDTDVEQVQTNKNNILSLSPTAYTAPRPNTNYNITIESGGYFVCGKICFINVRLTVGTDIPNNMYFLYGLPEALTPLAAGSSICTLTNNRGAYISVASQGNLLNASGAAITAGQLLLNGAYLIK